MIFQTKLSLMKTHRFKVELLEANPLHQVIKEHNKAGLETLAITC